MMLGHAGRRSLGVLRFLHVGALALVLLGCESHMVAFQPVNASRTEGIEQPTIRYDVQVGPSVLGTATLWSEGASEEEAGPRFFDVHLAIHNTTAAPIRLDVEKSRVTASIHERRRQFLGTPASRSGPETIEADSTGSIALRFALPRGLSASDVEQFEFEWRLESAAGDYRQSTRFAAAGGSPTNAEGLLATCVGANGFNASCKDDRDTPFNR